MFNSGVEAERTSNYTEAIFYYSMAIDMDSKYEQAYEKRGDVYRRLKNYGKAKQDYIWVVNINSGNTNVMINLGIMNYELGYYKDAASNFTKAIETRGEDATLFYYRGNAYNKNNEFEKAAEDYAKALNLQPDYSDARDKLDKLKAENKITEIAEVKKEEIKKEEVKKEESKPIVENTEVKKEEENKTIVENTEVKKEEEIVKTTDVIKESEPVVEVKLDAQDFILKGLAFYENKDFVSALNEYNKAVEISTDFAEAYYHRGRAYTELNDYTSAINEYTKTIELNPNHEKAYINRGFIYNETKEFEKAISDFKRGVEINPNSIIGFYNMGIAYYSLGNKPKTVESFQMAARLGDTDSQDWLKSNGYSW
jgi:tetratricopeptide (TPR) repeat protein